MATAKPQRDYESLPPIAYQPSPDELRGLVATMEGVVKIPLDAEFTEKVRRMLICYRSHVDKEKNAPRHESQYVELEQLQKAASKLHIILSREGMSTPLRMRLSELMIVNNLAGDDDPIYGLRRHLEGFLYICGKARTEYLNEMDGGAERITLAKFRHTVAEELARALDSAGYKPTATRGAPFEKCLEALLGSGSCSVQGRKIEDKPLKDYFFIVRLAVKNYPLKPIASFIQVKKHPSITG